MKNISIEELQSHVGASPDGHWGPLSIAACQDHLRKLIPYPNPWPKSDESSLRAFYGKAGDESQLVNLDVSGFGVRYEGQEIKTIRGHGKLASSLGRIIKQLSIHHPEILADYNGCYNFRKMRGGSSYSLHARGAAIDFMAGENGNKTSWPSKATMPITAMEIFARDGWLSAGAFWGRDAMHFQATR
jgi:hypothetical protein